MPITLPPLPGLASLPFDTIIDVRSPAEYAEDHIPGAINLPALSNEERAEVGTIYKQQSPFVARKLGAALVARNVAGHLLGPLREMSGGWRPLVYCWRGGQRSGSFAIILGQIGWRVDTIAGGYKSYRSMVVAALNDQPLPCPLIVLDGNTGSAKTDILNLLPGLGVQVIDLEGLARHRGSLFGAMPGGQPDQKGFDTEIAMAIAGLDPSRPVVVEAESSKVGNIRLPVQLWKAMQAAPRVAIAAPPRARASYLTRAYTDLIADPQRLAAIIDQLRPAHSAEVIEGWQAMAGAGQFEPLAADLMERHYDPRYLKHRARVAEGRFTEIAAERLEEGDLPELAAQVARRVKDLL
jgi:tRNA 2-selenouridine synthase